MVKTLQVSHYKRARVDDPQNVCKKAQAYVNNGTNIYQNSMPEAIQQRAQFFFAL